MIRILKSVYYGLAVAMLFILGSFTVNYAMNEYTNVQYSKQISQEDVCRTVGDYALTFMSNRQSGVSLTDSRKEFKNSNPPKVISDILDMVLTQAYELPIVDDKVNAILQFSVMYMSSCFATLEEKETPKGQEI